MNDARHHVSFVFSPENAEKAQEVCSRYPEDRRQSAVLLSRGHMLADSVAILGAMDIVFGEVDR